MRFKILHTNDVHSHFENFAKISSKIKQEKNEQTIILDAGDYHDFMDVMLQGTNGSAGVELLLEAGYDAITIGNNEGSAGLRLIKSMLSQKTIPFLSSNLVDLNGDEIIGVKRSIILTKSNIRFLIVGITPKFKSFDMGILDYQEQIENEINEHKGNYDVCILLSHLGLKVDKEIAQDLDGIDIIIGGHSHDLLEEPIFINETVLHMSGGYGEHLGVVSFDYNGTIKNITAHNLSVEQEIQDESILQIIKKNKKLADDKLSPPLYEIKKEMWHDVVEENPITNLLADALKDVFLCDLGLINSGILNSGIRKGGVSLKKLFEVCPSPLNPTIMEIKGKYVKKALQQSLNPEVCYRDGKGAGFRGKYLGKLHVSGAIIEHDGTTIQRILINGELLQDERIYHVATSDYLQRGSGYPDLAMNQNERYKSEFFNITLRDYLCKHDYIENAYVDRWIRK